MFAARWPGATIMSTGGMCRGLLWFIISFNGQQAGSFSGCHSKGSGVEVLNCLGGHAGAVYRSSEDSECLFKYRFATVIFSVPSILSSESELALSLLLEGELYCAPVSLTLNEPCIVVCVS